MSAARDFDKKHALVQQLLYSVDIGETTEEELEQLYYDLQYIFACPFEKAIETAEAKGSTYFEIVQDNPN